MFGYDHKVGNATACLDMCLENTSCRSFTLAHGNNCTLYTDPCLHPFQKAKANSSDLAFSMDAGISLSNVTLSKCHKLVNLFGENVGSVCPGEERNLSVQADPQYLLPI